MRLFSFPLLLLAVGLTALPAETVTWYAVDLPPLYILSGPHQGEGQLDLLTAFLRDKLPEYQHRKESANIPRIIERMKASDLAVFAGAQKTPGRAAVALFSAPFLATQPPVLVVRRGDAPRLAPFTDGRGAVDLGRWVKDHSLGLVAGRSYTTPVDTLLSEQADPARLVRRFSASELAGGLVTMLTGGRIDGILSFRSELAAVPGAETATAAFELQGIPEYVPLYLIVTKSPAGETLVRKINGLLKAYWNDPVMRGRDLYPDSDFLRRFLAQGYQEP